MSRPSFLSPQCKQALLQPGGCQHGSGSVAAALQRCCWGYRWCMTSASTPQEGLQRIAQSAWTSLQLMLSFQHSSPWRRL